MADMVKKVMKAKETGLKDGEQVQAAIFVNDSGAIQRAAVYGGIGGLLGMFVGSKVQKSASAKKGEMNKTKMSEAAPYGMGYIAVTDSRVLFYDHSTVSGKPKQVVAELARGDVSVENFEKGKMAGSLVLNFKDGGRRGYDVPRGNDVEAFQAAL